ncbi:MAG: aminodeoxychorismate synthase component I [Dehalococcoidia bacterium]|nr:MAG: aminodeoxychorismate synthase component I [Dehalococcoidia bacterium]
MTEVRYPFVEEIRLPLAPPAAFELFKERPYSFFLDSGMDAGKLGRYSFIGSDPFLVLKSRGDEIRLISGGKEGHQSGNPFDVLGQLLNEYRLDTPEEMPVPFSGGAVGYLSYDLGRFIERLPSEAVDDLQLPESYLGFYDMVIAFDNLTGKAYTVANGFPETEETKRLDRASRRIEETRLLLSGSGMRATSSPPETGRTLKPVALSSSFKHEEYLAAVARARKYIVDGDIFEVNLSQRFAADLNTAPYELYQRLRQINPAPFAAYLGFEEVAVASASPERFLRRRDDLVETRPIKGTRRRGKTLEQDKALAEELLASAKDRAENIMIVDLERNDLGRVCRFGSVKVTELAILETFPTVFHLTSTIEGRLSPGKNTASLLKATFPGGSITGAPKVRAMEIIDELEPTRRSVYTGAVGYLGFNGDLDLNIAIRTFIIKDQKAYFQVGGAVVYDSDPESEYQETLDKGRALVDALNLTRAQATNT